MSLYLEIISGDQTGIRFPAVAGATIGRRKCDILLRDSKISGRHAHLEARRDGLYIVDDQSSNGIKIGDGEEKVPELRLEPGVTLRLGRTVFKVTSGARDAKVDETPDEISISVSLTPEPIEDPWPAWIRTLIETTRATRLRTRNNKHEMASFQPTLRLKIFQGIQAGETWTLGYGPRSVGAETLDLTLQEAGCPAICFELAPHKNGPVFRTGHPDTVLLNGKNLECEYLAHGDIIQVKNTKIEVLITDHE